MIDMPFLELMDTYGQLYKTYGEGNTTSFEVETARRILGQKDGIYLNFGCGKWSGSMDTLRAEGYNVIGYEPCPEASSEKAVGNKLENLKAMFDGIYSHNVMEHLQRPLETMKTLKGMLNPHARMAHSTNCYRYTHEHSRWHLFFFVGKSVDFLCEKCGLEICDRSMDDVPFVSFRAKTS
jgi:hypothetical protein